MRPSRVILADDHAIVLEGLRRVLDPEFDIVAEVTDGRALVAATETLQPDLLVADISMPILNGIEAARQIRKVNQKVKIVFLTMHPDVTYASEALSAGGSAYVLKSSAGTEILEAMRQALGGRIYVSRLIDKAAVMAQMERPDRPDELRSKLTPRQREVLQLLADGKNLKEVAAILAISIKTVEFHKYQIMKQLGIRTNAGLTKHAVKLGMTSL